MKAFHIFMSLYLSQPIHYHEDPALLKYIDTISDLSERGGNWLTYDETFRALRSIEGWGGTRQYLNCGWEQLRRGFLKWDQRMVERPFRTRERSADDHPIPVLPSIKDKCVTWVRADTSTNVDIVVQATQCQNAQPPCPDRPIPVSCQLPCCASTADNECVPSPVSPAVLSQLLQGYDEYKSEYLMGLGRDFVLDASVYLVQPVTL